MRKNVVYFVFLLSFASFAQATQDGSLKKPIVAGVILGTTIGLVGTTVWSTIGTMSRNLFARVGATLLSVVPVFAALDSSGSFSIASLHTRRQQFWIVLGSLWEPASIYEGFLGNFAGVAFYNVPALLGALYSGVVHTPIRQAAQGKMTDTVAYNISVFISAALSSVIVKQWLQWRLPKRRRASV